MVQRIFARISLKLPKSFCATFAYKFYSTKIVKTFFGMISKKRPSRVFLQTMSAIFLNQTTSVAFSARFSENLPIFSGNLPGFSTNQNFGVELAPQLPTPLPSIMTNLWYCDKTRRSDIVTEQERSSLMPHLPDIVLLTL